jgi:hypothetical protein
MPHRSNGRVASARLAANRLAFAPFAFQAARVARQLGLLAELSKVGGAGLTTEELASATGVSAYGVRVLLETCLPFDVVRLSGDRWSITDVGLFWLDDPMTRVNVDFVHHINWLGFFSLDQAIVEGRPAGLPQLGPWSTIYEGLSKLPPVQRAAWLDFDHFYSDTAFPAALDLVFRDPPRHLLDIGGNTGRFASQFAARDPNVKVTILDHPGQLEMAGVELRKKGIDHRVSFFPVDLLVDSAAFPADADAAWMSQLLVCFSPSEATSILRRAREAVEAANGRVFVLDTCWDLEGDPTAVVCLLGTSPYFTALANGNSQMYKATDIERFAADAGLKLTARHGGLGISHTLFEFRPA